MEGPEATEPDLTSGYRDQPPSFSYHQAFHFPRTSSEGMARIQSKLKPLAVLAGLLSLPLLQARAQPPRQIPIDPAPVVIGEPLPDVTLRTLAGEPWSPASLEGRPAVLFFWAAWCRSCLGNLEGIVAFAHEHPEIAFYTVNIDRQPGKARAAGARMPGFDLPVLVDHRCLLMGQLDVTSLPVFFVVDPGGVVRHRETGWRGEETAQALQEVLDELP